MTVTVPSWGRTLRHDSANRLVAVEDGARRTSFRYDAFGALDGVCVSEAGEAPVCTAVLLDTSGSLPVVIGTVRTARDAVLYAHGVSGVAAQTALSNGVPSDVYYGISDERRSLRALVKAGPVAGAAEVVHRKAYDAYGVLRATEGPFGSAIGFAGEWTTPEGWTWNRARFVIPELGRLDRRDTFAGYAAVTPSLNRYAYANNDPVNKVDPTGMAATYGADEMLLQAGIGAGDTFVNSFLNMPASTWNLLSWGLSGVNRALGQESVYAPTPNWVGHARGALGTDIAGLEETGGYKAGAIGMTVAMAVRDLYKLGRYLGSIRRVATGAGDNAATLRGRIASSGDDAIEEARRRLLARGEFAPADAIANNTPMGTRGADVPLPLELTRLGAAAYESNGGLVVTLSPDLNATNVYSEQGLLVLLGHGSPEKKLGFFTAESGGLPVSIDLVDEALRPLVQQYDIGTICMIGSCHSAENGNLEYLTSSLRLYGRGVTRLAYVPSLAEAPPGAMQVPRPHPLDPSSVIKYITPRRLRKP
jgi:RHS repeat-associated protein